MHIRQIVERALDFGIGNKAFPATDPVLRLAAHRDFGISKAFQHAALIAVSISERDVPLAD